MEIILYSIIAALVVVILFMSRKGETSSTQQLLDLKNQLTELRNKQMESQSESFSQQQKLLLETQKELREQLGNIMKNVNEGMAQNQTNLTEQLKNSNQVIANIQTKLGNLEESTQSIKEIGKDIASLQDILKTPKLRGNLGEYLLEELLKDIFPSSNYETKYTFKNGTQVDAVIKLGEGIIPVDSKFPMESFARLVAATSESDKKVNKKAFINAVKKQIDDIASKYIQPGEGTFDFAMIYIPAENIFYETIINDSLTEKDYEILNYAIQKHVIPVSPNSFYAYLMAIVYGLKGFKIEQQAKTIMNELANVQQSFGKFYDEFTIVGRHLGNANNKYFEAEKKAEKFNIKIGQITGNKTELAEINSVLPVEQDD